MDKHTGKTSEELRAEYLKIRAQAEQDVADLNSGRVMAPFSSLRRMVRRLRRRPVLLLQNIGSGCGYQLFWEHHDGTREKIKTGLAAPGDCIPVPAKTECRWIEAGGNREGHVNASRLPSAEHRA